MPECKTSVVTKQLISNIDVIVDGKFDESKMDRKLKFRGSSNQRIIDVKETLHDNAIKMVKFTDQRIDKLILIIYNRVAIKVMVILYTNIT